MNFKKIMTYFLTIFNCTQLYLTVDVTIIELKQQFLLFIKELLRVKFSLNLC